jgi:hypothetical protein
MPFIALTKPGVNRLAGTVIFVVELKTHLHKLNRLSPYYTIGLK